ncbi:MAG: TonB family protein [Planctomycetes bacterium]|nr:TonB family protein [Planctomycetota bacterium]
MSRFKSLWISATAHAAVAAGAWISAPANPGVPQGVPDAPAALVAGLRDHAQEASVEFRERVWLAATEFPDASDTPEVARRHVEPECEPIEIPTFAARPSEPTLKIHVDPRVLVVVPTEASSPVSAPGPELLSMPHPKYPTSSRRRGEEGEVVITFEVTAAGAVRNPVVAKSSGYRSLDEAALDAVRAARYKVSAPARDSITVVFRLQ